MPATVLEQIAEELERRCSGVTSRVVRPQRREAYTPENRQVVIKQDDPERNFELDQPGNPPAICWNQRFNLHLHIRPSDTDATSVDSLVNQFYGDVLDAITNSSTTDPWHTFNALAINSVIEAPEHIDADESVDGLNLPITVVYRTDETDPFRSRG